MFKPPAAASRSPRHTQNSTYPGLSYLLVPSAQTSPSRAGIP